ncbi:MAG TPA: cytochrome c peroxidase [Ferruginibacter sp.]|nr:cytochrome c peroxidase [Ferruginibacter sp.]
MKARVILLLCVTVMSGALWMGATVPDLGYPLPPDPLPLQVPAGWPKPLPQVFAKNKPTEQGFQLGKKLFYDQRLSKNGQVSCANCHQQFAAFATFDHDLSHGLNDVLGKRNAPALMNLAWMPNLHWDGGINHLEVQPLHPLTAPDEMGESLDSIILKIKSDTSYTKMFRAAFGDAQINTQRMLRALTQFTGHLVSANSKYDKVQRGEASFTEYEKRGYELYKANCAACHPEPLFTDNSFRNNGLSLNRFHDIGRQAITGKPSDSLAFKVPTLRNVQMSYPYMHDGRFYSLYHVIDHYRSGIDTTQPTLDPQLKNRIQMTTKQRNELVYFLYTLTDSSFIKNPRFSPGNAVLVPGPNMHKAGMK